MSTGLFARVVTGKRGLLQADLDRTAPEVLLRTMAARTGVKPYELRTMLLKHFEGTAFERLNPIGHSPWILALGQRGLVQQGYGRQYCPRCLGEDPYYKSEWRLGFIVVCPRHRGLMLDRCESCGSPYSPYRVAFHPDRHPARTCWSCDGDLTTGRSPFKAGPRIYAFQAHLRRTVRHGWVAIPGHDWLYSFAYLAVLRRLCAMMRSSRRAPRRLALALADRLHIECPPRSTAAHAELEFATPLERYRFLLNGLVVVAGLARAADVRVPSPRRLELRSAQGRTSPTVLVLAPGPSWALRRCDPPAG